MSTVAVKPTSETQSRAEWLFERLGSLGTRRGVRVVFGVALLLATPSLFGGFSTDDHLIRYELTEPKGEPGIGTPPFALFRWFEADQIRRLVDRGMLPWWTHERALMAFMRPLSSLTHTLDHALWPNAPFWMHVHSVLWFACMLWITRRVYVELCGNAWVAGLASAMFALNGAHGVAVGWISNRNALLGSAFGAAALLCHHRFRIGAGLRYAALALVSLALSLLSTEAGISSACYVLAYALFYDRAALRARVASALPYGLLILGWLSVRHYGQYGAYGMGGYIDPVQQPLAFLAALPERTLVAVASQLAGVGADLYAWMPAELQPTWLFCGVVGCGIALWFVWPGLRTERASWMFGAGVLLASVPLVAALPSDRVLGPIGFGIMPLLARGIHDAVRLVQSREVSARLRSRFAVLLVGLHLGLGAVLLPINAILPAAFEDMVATAERSAPRDAALTQQTMIVTDLTESILLNYFGAMRALNGRPRPEKLYWLGATRDATTFERVGPRTLRARCPSGLFDSHWIDRASSLPLAAGERVALAEMDVHVVEVTPDGRPTVADFEFRETLESPRYRWLRWKRDRFEEFSVPAADPSLYQAARGN